MASKTVLIALPVGLLVLLAVSITDSPTIQQLYVNTTYYFLMATVLCWAGAYLNAARETRGAEVISWVRENWPGLVIALVVTVVAGLSVHPALRILSDEANLVGISKNLWSNKTATFTISGKYYYESYWDIDVAIDQRPPLFPFLVSLLHVALGYSYKNAFLLNLLVLPAFVVISYRLAKSLGGETMGVIASLLVVAHPVLLLSVRSAGFDFITVFFALLVLKSLLDFTHDASATKLAVLWMNLCMFAEVRYETALFIPPMLVLLLLFRMITWSTLRPYALIYALTPAYLLPRIWLSALRGNVPKQDPGTVTLSVENFFNNAHEYFKPVLSPFHSYPAHSAVVIALGVAGCVLWLRRMQSSVRAQGWKTPRLQFAVFVGMWMALQFILVFTYFWGRAQYPSAARLVIAIDTFFSFAAAGFVTLTLKRSRPFVGVLLAFAVLAFNLPLASQHRMLNRLTQTRESATTWRFFEGLHEKRILIVTDRPNHFTIMDYGAMNFEAAKRDPFLFEAWGRHLFYDIYVVQQIQLSTGTPLPGYDIWPTRKFETMLVFQNDANVLIRIARLAR